MILFASIASSNLVDNPPELKGTGTSFRVPIILILEPGVVFAQAPPAPLDDG